MDRDRVCHCARALTPYHVKEAGQNAQFAGTGQRADSVHLVEKLCSFHHLDHHRHTRERAGMRDRGGSAVGARYIFCAPGPAVQGRSSRASSPARPSLDLEHALPSALSPLDQVAKLFNNIELMVARASRTSSALRAWRGCSLRVARCTGPLSARTSASERCDILACSKRPTLSSLVLSHLGRIGRQIH